MAVKCPEEEDLNDFYAANLVDFFNDLVLLYDIVAEKSSDLRSKAFPPGYEYRWQNGDKLVTVKACEYVDFVFLWVADQISNERIFPSSADVEFPQDFEGYVRDIFKKLFRVYAIIYHSFFKEFEALGGTKHLNTCFKHFMFFVFEYNLVDAHDLNALESVVAKLREDFKKQGKTSFS